MKVFRSQLEDLMPAKELCFEATAGFGEYRPFLEHAIAHPAKMNMHLLEFLIKSFTREGETVLDPMCGSGSMGVVAALNGRNAVQVDIESKFVAWADESKRKVDATPTLTPKGSIRNVQRDSRKLSALLEEADAIVTSPPYSDSQTEVAGEKGRRGGDAKQRVKKDYAGISDENIGSLPHGNIDAVITSPPFADGFKPGTQNKEKRLQRLIECDRKGAERGSKWAISTREAIERRLAQQDDGYGKTKENIGNLPFDAVITSPPYEETLSVKAGGRQGRLDKDETTARKKLPVPYSEDSENIGNLKKETYLKAMLKVYMEMFKVLKPNGLAIIVIKPFIRNRHVVDLPSTTWLLLEKVGFKLTEIFKLRLEYQSFWRILYNRKYPDVPRIRHEYVLVTQK